MSSGDSERVVSVSARGQATIPKRFREKLGIDAPGRVKFVETADGEVVVRPITSVTDLRGVLADETDEAGRTGTELLRAARSRDTADATVSAEHEDGASDEPDATDTGSGESAE